MIIVVLLASAFLFAAGWVLSSTMSIGKSEGTLFLNKDASTGRSWLSTDINVWDLEDGEEITLKIKRDARNNHVL